MTTPHQPDTERQEFEAYWRDRMQASWIASGCDKNRGPTPSENWGSAYVNYALGGWLAGRAAAQAQIAELENKLASGIHTCGPACSRPACVAARRIASLEAAARKVVDARHNLGWCTEVDRAIEALARALAVGEIVRAEPWLKSAEVRERLEGGK